MIRGIFVTGTDTGVGKTFAACALIHALKRQGVAPMPMKPVAAGASMHDGVLANEDSIALMRAASREMSLMPDVTPVLLREPMAPHIAAAREGRRISLDPILASFATPRIGERLPRRRRRGRLRRAARRGPRYRRPRARPRTCPS